MNDLKSYNQDKEKLRSDQYTTTDIYKNLFDR